MKDSAMRKRKGFESPLKTIRDHRSNHLKAVAIELNQNIFFTITSILFIIRLTGLTVNAK